eukprot:306494-Pyramimonas_sp.AAC.1
MPSATPQSQSIRSWIATVRGWHAQLQSGWGSSEQQQHKSNSRDRGGGLGLSQFAKGLRVLKACT